MIKAFSEATNRKIRVFISSTFVDMSEERNIIVNNVFPKLRKHCRNRMIDITEIDLRWGINQNDAENGQVINICLGEVVKCRPFFLGILGDRYGYIPESSDVEKVDESIKKEIDSFPRGISITEMEMRMGALNSPIRACASFYFRVDNKLVETDEEKIEKLVSLKNNITQKHKSKFYRNLFELEELIFNDLISHINEKFPDIPQIPYNDKNYFAHLNILKNNSESYLANQKLIGKITESKESIVLYGQNGSGKTAAVAYVAKQVSQSVNVFFHFVSADSDSYRINNIYHRLRLFLDELVPDEIRNDNEDLIVKEQLGHLKKDVVIIIDGINLVQGSPNPSVEISRLIRKNVRIIMTHSEKIVLGDFLSIEMPKLTSRQVIQITNCFFKQFSKKFPKEKALILCRNKGCSNPLFLKIIINEIRRFGSFEDFDLFFNNICAIDTFCSLYAFIIDRFIKYCDERKISREFIELIPSLILCSNKGLSEKEIMDITHLPPMMWASFYSFLETYIIEFNGKIKISNTEFAKAITLAFDEKMQTKKARLMLYDYFMALDTNRKIEEGIFQEFQLGYLYGLITSLCNKKTFDSLYETDYYLVVEYFASCKSLCEKIIETFMIDDFAEPEKLIRFCETLMLSGCFSAGLKIIELYLDMNQSPKDRLTLKGFRARILYKLAQNKYELSNEAYRDLIFEFNTVYPDDEIGLAEHKFKYAISLNSSGHPDKAGAIYEEVIAVFRKHGIKNHISSWVLGNLADNYYTVGRFDMADKLFREAIEIRKELFGNDSKEVAWVYCSCFANLFAMGQYNEAYFVAEKAKNINIGLEYAWSIQNFGIMLLHKKQYDEAIGFFSESIEINDSVLEQEARPHVYSLTAFNNRAVAYYLKGQKESALEMIDKTMQYKEEKLGKNHLYTANTYLNYANMLSLAHREKANEYISKAISVFEHNGTIMNDHAFALICKLALLTKENNETEILKLKQSITTLLEKNISNAGPAHYIYSRMDKVFVVNNFLEKAFALNRFYLAANNESEIILLPKFE